MTAKITDKIKKLAAQQIFDEITGTKLGDSDNYYYIAVGRSQNWTDEDNPDTPQQTLRDERLFRYDLQAAKSIQAFSFVIPLKDWSSGTEYVQYSDAGIGQADNYYVRTDENNVYICIKQGKTSIGAARTSTVKPDHTDVSIPVETDGYAWKFLYTITTGDGNSFLTANWMPVKDPRPFANPASAYHTSYLVSEAADSGQVVGYRVISGGSGYDASADTVTVVGDGSGASARLLVNASGAITAVEVGDSDNVGQVSYGTVAENMGTGYNKASVRVTSSTGTGASVVPVIGPRAGLGYDPRDDLRSTALLFNIVPSGNEGGKWLVDNQYRQIGILKNPFQGDSAVAGSAFTAPRGTILPKLSLTTNGAAGTDFSGTIYLQGDSNAIAIIDYIENLQVWYHQNETTGFTPFRHSEPVFISSDLAGLNTVVSSLTVDSFTPPEINAFSGDVLYISNVSDVPRETDGSEDVKAVVKF